MVCARSRTIGSILIGALPQETITLAAFRAVHAGKIFFNYYRRILYIRNENKKIYFLHYCSCFAALHRLLTQFLMRSLGIQKEPQGKHNLQLVSTPANEKILCYCKTSLLYSIVQKYLKIDAVIGSDIGRSNGNSRL